MAKFSDYPLATAVTSADRLLAVQDGVNKQIDPEHVSGLFAIGVGQTWQNVVDSRAIDITYTNTSGRPILVAVHVFDNRGVDYTSSFQLNIGGVFLGNFESYRGGASGWFVVPDGATYSVGSLDVGYDYISAWSELK
ncbi:MAG: hypothetical protein ISEC1_P1935 [Thiomicrorhabdus sp.]|nr:MAG: hypothetical protein ISEC1_P1935 [Thiomicrorhabdus sp.]